MVTVIVPSLISRHAMLAELLADCAREGVAALALVDAGGISLGRKMDMLADECETPWAAGGGDDDRILPGYGDALREACAVAPEWVGGVYFPVAYSVSEQGKEIESGVCFKRPGKTCEPIEGGNDLIRPPADRTAIRTSVRQRLRHPDRFWAEDYWWAGILWKEDIGLIPVRNREKPLYEARHRNDDPYGTDWKQKRDRDRRAGWGEKCVARMGIEEYLKACAVPTWDFNRYSARAAEDASQERVYVLVEQGA